MAQQRDFDVQFTVASNIYNTQENIWQVTNKALMIAVLEMCRRAQGGMGPAIYTPTDNLRAILLGLMRQCEWRTPVYRERGGDAVVGRAMEPQRAN